MRQSVVRAEKAVSNASPADEKHTVMSKESAIELRPEVLSNALNGVTVRQSSISSANEYKTKQKKDQDQDDEKMIGNNDNDSDKLQHSATSLPSTESSENIKIVKKNINNGIDTTVRKNDANDKLTVSENTTAISSDRISSTMQVQHGHGNGLGAENVSAQRSMQGNINYELT